MHDLLCVLYGIQNHPHNLYYLYVLLPFCTLIYNFYGDHHALYVLRHDVYDDAVGGDDDGDLIDEKFLFELIMMIHLNRKFTKGWKLARKSVVSEFHVFFLIAIFYLANLQF